MKIKIGNKNEDKRMKMIKMIMKIGWGIKMIKMWNKNEMY